MSPATATGSRRRDSVGSQLCAGITRDDVRPGPQRRWDHRSRDDDDRDVRFDQPEPGREHLCAGGVGRPAEARRRGGGDRSVRRGTPIAAERTWVATRSPGNSEAPTSTSYGTPTAAACPIGQLQPQEAARRCNRLKPVSSRTSMAAALFFPLRRSRRQDRPRWPGGQFLSSGCGAQLDGTSAELRRTYVTAGQFGSWTPIGAEWTGNGYQVAWKMALPTSIRVATDRSGNYLSQTGPMFRSSSRLEVYEPSLQQDLNNDSLIGVPASAFNIDISYSVTRPTSPTSLRPPSDGSRSSRATCLASTFPVTDLSLSAYNRVSLLHRLPGPHSWPASPEYYRTSGYLPITASLPFYCWTWPAWPTTHAFFGHIA